jgi:hypothetical protein
MQAMEEKKQIIAMPRISDKAPKTKTITMQSKSIIVINMIAITYLFTYLKAML